MQYFFIYFSSHSIEAHLTGIFDAFVIAKNRTFSRKQTRKYRQKALSACGRIGQNNSGRRQQYAQTAIAGQVDSAHFARRSQSARTGTGAMQFYAFSVAATQRSHSRTALRTSAMHRYVAASFLLMLSPCVFSTFSRYSILPSRVSIMPSRL